MIKTLTVGI